MPSISAPTTLGSIYSLASPWLCRSDEWDKNPRPVATPVASGAVPAAGSQGLQAKRLIRVCRIRRACRIQNRGKGPVVRAQSVALYDE